MIETITGAPPEGKTRRRYPRVTATGRAFASIGDGQEGSILNMSLGGILLRLRRVLTPGSSYFLKLFFDGREAVVEARVVHLLIRSGDFLAGMEFVRLSAGDREALERFLGPAASPN